MRPTVDMKSLLATAGNLRSGAHRIPAARLDLRLVKCWYHAGTAWQGIAQDKLHRMLVPNLILHDDRLVKVDYEKQDDYLHGNFPDGERYLWISDASKSLTVDIGAMLPVDRLPDR